MSRERRAWAYLSRVVEPPCPELSALAARVGPVEAADRVRHGAVPAERSHDRGAADLRPVEIEPGFVRTADGSALYAQGGTRVICTASVTEGVPR